jgi:HEAT repeat protein
MDMSRRHLKTIVTLLALAAVAAPAHAGIDAPLSLGIIVTDARSIVVLEVEQFLPERGAVVYKKVVELKGKHAGTHVRHVRVPAKPQPATADATWKRNGPPPEALAELLAPGRRAAFFHDGTSGVVYLGDGCWYAGGVSGEGAAANWGLWLPQYGFGYAGSVAQLQDHVRAMVQGKEVVVTAFAATPTASDQLFSLLMEPRRVALPMWQIRAGPEITRLPGCTPRRFGEGYACELDEEGRKLVVARGSGRAADVETLVAGLKDAKGSVRRRHAEELGVIGPQARAAVPGLAGLLKDAEPTTRVAAATALVRVAPGQRAAEVTLLDALKDKTLSLRLEAVDALWLLDLAVPATVPALATALDDPEKKVRERAAAALRSLLHSVNSGDRVTTADLVVALKVNDADCRRLAVIALRHQAVDQARGAIPEVVKALKDQNSWVRAEAAGTLARLDPRHVAIVPALVGILSDQTHKQVYPGGMIRKAALEALARVGPAARPAVPALVEALEELREVHEVMGILKQLGTDAKLAVPALQKALKQPGPGAYPELPLLAATSLADIAPRDPGNKPAISVLISWLKDGMKRMPDRVLAAEALGRFGAVAAPAIPALEDACKDPFEEVRQAASVAIQQIRGK